MMDLYDLRKLYEDKGSKEKILSFYSEYITREPSKIEEILEYALDYLDTDAVNLLFESGLNSSWANVYGYTLFHKLALRRTFFKYPEGAMEKMVNLLLDKKVSVLKKDSNENMTAYHYAARDGNCDFIEALAKRDAKLDMSGANGNTALHELADRYYANEKNEEKKQNYIKTAQLLIDAGVDIGAKNDYRQTAGSIIIEKKATILFGLLVEDPNIFQAIYMKAYDIIKEMASESINDVSFGDKYTGATPLEAACIVADDKIVEILLNANADVNNKNNDDIHPLLALVRTKNPNIDALKNNLFKTILDMFKNKGWDINSRINKEGDTLLTYTLKQNFNSSAYNSIRSEQLVIQWLIENNANLDIPNSENITPLMYTCLGDANEMEDVLLSLLENGANINAVDNNGQNVLHYCAMNRAQGLTKTMADLLFSFGKPDVNLANNNGKTPIDLATEANNEELLKYLLLKL